jgi:HD-GYP domain-containing protein (c-di-GMP phosphodiesterase class II)
MKTIAVEALVPGMVVARDVYTRNGQLIVSEGTKLTLDIIMKFTNWGIFAISIEEPTFSQKDQQEKLIAAQISVAHDRVVGITENIFANNDTGAIDPDLLRGMVGDLDNQLELNSNVLLNLSHLKSYDNYVYLHSVNVCVLTLIIGKKLKLSVNELHDLGLAAVLHDYGMIRLDSAIFNHERRLTDAEWLKIKGHPYDGYEMLKKSGAFNEAILAGILDHHERLDGSGYPNSKNGDRIHLFGKIIAVADVYDACISPRKHRPRLTPNEALKNLLGQAHLFDINILKAFVAAMAVYPIGCFVRLNTGEIGKVIGINDSSPFRPEIRIVLDRQRQKLEPPIRINLLDEEYVHTYIAETLSGSELDEVYRLLEE